MNTIILFVIFIIIIAICYIYYHHCYDHYSNRIPSPRGVTEAKALAPSTTAQKPTPIQSPKIIVAKPSPIPSPKAGVAKPSPTPSSAAAKPSPISAVCAFDLDNTITCGLEQAKEAIAHCRKRNAKITINTARPTKWYSDININKLGLTEDDLNEFYHGDINQSVENTKVRHLITMSNKWNVPRNKVILFDDLISNINSARENGFSAIHANNQTCGLPTDVTKQIDEILG